MMKRYPKGTWMRLKSSGLLVEQMKYRHMSMSRLARYADCSKAMIGHLCSGYKTSCTPELAQRIAEALDVPVEILFDPRVSAVGGRIDRRERVA